MQPNLKPNVSETLSRIAVSVNAFSSFLATRGKDQKQWKSLQDLGAIAKRTRHTLEGLSFSLDRISNQYGELIRTIILSE